MDRDATADKMQGSWKLFKGKLREKWGDLTDDELDRIKGRREQLVGYLQKQSGRGREELDKELDSYSRETGYRFE